MIVGEKSSSRVLEVQHSDHFILVDQRHRQLRPRLRIPSNVSRILIDVWNQYRLAVLPRITHHSPAQRNFVFELNIFLEALRETMLKLLPSGIEQQDAEHLIVDQPAKQFRDALQQLVQIENGCKLARDFIEQDQG